MDRRILKWVRMDNRGLEKVRFGAVKKGLETI
jgi:hypothetical protein